MSKVTHHGKKLPNDRDVWLGQFSDSYSLVFRRPAEDKDNEGLPEYVSFEDDKVVTKLSLSGEAMAALVELYINRDYNEAKKVSLSYWEITESNE